MNHFIGFCIRRPFTVFSILAALTLLLAPGLLRLEIDNSIETIMPQNDPKYKYYNHIKDIYGDNGQFIVMAVSADDLFSHATLESFDCLITDIEAFQDFHPNKAKARLVRFMGMLDRESIRTSDLFSQFADDPAFQRTLRRKVNDLFGSKETLSKRNLNRLKKELRKVYEIKRQELVDEIMSPLTAQDIRGEMDVLEVYDLIETDRAGRRIIPETPAEIRRFKQRLMRNPAFAEMLYARDSATGEISDYGVLIKFKNQDLHRDAATRELISIFDSYSDLSLTYTGMPVIHVWAYNFIRMDFATLVPMVMLVVMAVFYFNFRSIRGVCLPMLSLAMAEIWVLGLMGYLGFKITVMASSLPTLMIAVGSSYAIHILNQYYNDFDFISQKGKQKGLFIAMTHISLTVLLTGITTFIAFATLSTSQLSAVREWGIFSGIGAMFAVFSASALIPASLAVMPHQRPRYTKRKYTAIKQHKTLVDRFIRLMVRGANHHYRLTVVIAAIVLIICISGFVHLEVDTAHVSYFKKDSDVRKSVDEIGEKFGGGWGFDIIIDSGEPNGVKSPEFLKFIEEFRQWLENGENADLHIGRTDSFTDIIKTMHMAMNNDDAEAYKIPENKLDIYDYIEIYAGEDSDSDGRYDAFEPFVDFNYQQVNLLARLCRKEGQLIGTTEVGRIVEKMRGYLETHIPPGASFNISGFPVIEVQVSHYLVMGQIQTLVLSLIVVDLISILLFQRMAAGLLALIPMGVAVLINFGIMGWAGIALDMTTSVIAAVAIGIGIDDTIHFMNKFRHNRSRGYSVEESIELTLQVAGKAIIFTSLALIFGFLVFLRSQFIPINLLGILLSITMIAATFGALLVLPAFIQATNPNLSPPPQTNWFTRNLNLSRWFGLDEVE